MLIFYFVGNGIIDYNGPENFWHGHAEETACADRIIWESCETLVKKSIHRTFAKLHWRDKGHSDQTECYIIVTRNMKNLFFLSIVTTIFTLGKQCIFCEKFNIYFLIINTMGMYIQLFKINLLPIRVQYLIHKQVTPFNNYSFTTMNICFKKKIRN